MPFDPISWAIIGFAVGALTATFWDDIRDWATRALQAILNLLDLAVTVMSDTVVYLVKQGTRVYKKIEVFSRNIYSNATKRHEKMEEVSSVPAEFEKQLQTKSQIKLLQKTTA